MVNEGQVNQDVMNDVFEEYVYNLKVLKNTNIYDVKFEKVSDLIKEIKSIPKDNPRYEQDTYVNLDEDEFTLEILNNGQFWAIFVDSNGITAGHHRFEAYCTLYKQDKIDKDFKILIVRQIEDKSYTRYNTDKTGYVPLCEFKWNTFIDIFPGTWQRAIVENAPWIIKYDGDDTYVMPYIVHQCTMYLNMTGGLLTSKVTALKKEGIVIKGCDAINKEGHTFE